MRILDWILETIYSKPSKGVSTPNDTVMKIDTEPPLSKAEIDDFVTTLSPYKFNRFIPITFPYVQFDNYPHSSVRITAMMATRKSGTYLGYCEYTNINGEKNGAYGPIHAYVVFIDNKPVALIGSYSHRDTIYLGFGGTYIIDDPLPSGITNALKVIVRTYNAIMYKQTQEELNHNKQILDYIELNKNKILSLIHNGI